MVFGGAKLIGIYEKWISAVAVVYFKDIQKNTYCLGKRGKLGNLVPQARCLYTRASLNIFFVTVTTTPFCIILVSAIAIFSLFKKRGIKYGVFHGGPPHYEQIWKLWGSPTRLKSVDY